MTRLNAETLEAYLRDRGVVTEPAACTTTELTGGVSNDVFALTQPAGGTSEHALDLVLKQSLPELKVAQVWTAPVERILAEAKALRWIHAITPDNVPQVVDVDDGAMTLTMTSARPGMLNLRDLLMGGTVDRTTARRLGSCLGRWHQQTGDAETRAAFPDTFFEALRIEPYYRHTAAAHPDLAPVISAHARELVEDRTCLVHGDFTPKNVLAQGDAVWVLDWEVAHFGNPVFDRASLTTHLILKAVHRPERRSDHQEFAETFLAAYDAERGPGDAVGPLSLTGHIGCLLLARVDGKSPADYLTPLEQDVVRRLARRVLAEGPTSPQAIWEMLDAS